MYTFINGNPALINKQKKLSNPPSWLLILLVATFNEIPLFPKDFTTFIISFISLFISFIPEPLNNYEGFTLVFY